MLWQDGAGNVKDDIITVWCITDIWEHLKSSARSFTKAGLKEVLQQLVSGPEMGSGMQETDERSSQLVSAEKEKEVRGSEVSCLDVMLFFLYHAVLKTSK